MTYRSRYLRAGLTGVATRRDSWNFANTSTRDERLNLSGWLRGDVDWVTVELRAQEAASWRESTVTDRESRQHDQSLRVEVSPTSHEELQYQFDRQAQTSATIERDFEQISHELSLRSSHRFVEDRGRFDLYARGARYRQTTTLTGAVPLVLVTPIVAEVALDDTPEFLDPLEADPVAEPGLFDRDLDTPTPVNIGDSAPVVRQYGGDFRNLIFDFGEVEAFSRIVLYVDRPVRFPQLMQWQVHVSDDPEGRDWSEVLPAATLSIEYVELEDGRQGWFIDLADPVRHRRVKLVNSKLGLTEPDLFVTEMEVLQPVDAGDDRQNVDRVTRYRLRSDVAFDVTDNLEVRYGLNLYGRSFDDGSRNTDSQSHLFGLNLRLGSWWLAASHQMSLEKRASRDDTDVVAQRVSLSSNRARRLHGLVAWSRTDDRSFAFQNLTNSVTGSLGWTIAPRLVLSQRLTYGVRDTRDGLDKARSWVSSTQLRGAPRPNLEIILGRNDRWVSREAGVAFTSFNDTELSANWAIFPLLNLNSQVLYQVRDDDDLLLRHTLSWSPLRGGSVALRFYVLDHRDTRSDYNQRGGGASAVWRARRRLRLEGGYEVTRLEQDGETNTPTLWNLRGTWTF